MISLLIEDTKDFMQKLLKDSLFDDFLCTQFELTHLYKVNIDGQLRPEFLGDEQASLLEERRFILWKDLQNIVYEMIKGNKTPTSMRIVLSLNKKSKEALLQQIHFQDAHAIASFSFIITYENKRIRIVTGTNYSTFIMDKQAEHHFDDSMVKFFKKHQITALLALD